MGIIAWIVLGLVAGAIASMLVPGRDPHGLVITTVIGVVGALLGGFLAGKLFDIDGIQGFFNITTWITAIAGAAILLVAYHLITARGSGRSGHGSGRRSGTRSGRSNRSNRWAGRR